MNRRRAEAPRAMPVLVEAGQKVPKSLPERQRETAEYLSAITLSQGIESQRLFGSR